MNIYFATDREFWAELHMWQDFCGILGQLLRLRSIISLVAFLEGQRESVVFVIVNPYPHEHYQSRFWTYVSKAGNSQAVKKKPISETFLLSSWLFRSSMDWFHRESQHSNRPIHKESLAEIDSVQIYDFASLLQSGHYEPMCIRPNLTWRIELETILTL